MILRFRSPDGSYRVEVQSTDDVSTLKAKLVDVVPKDTDPSSFVLSDKPANGQTRKLSDLAGLGIHTLGLKYKCLLCAFDQTSR